MRFLENLEHLLKINNMKKSDLAKHIGITQPTINAWYTKGYDNVSLSTLVKISKFFNIPLEELIIYITSLLLVFFICKKS